MKKYVLIAGVNTFYDNTENFRRFALCKKGKIVRISARVPKWFGMVEIDEE